MKFRNVRHRAELHKKLQHADLTRNTTRGATHEIHETPFRWRLGDVLTEVLAEIWSWQNCDNAFLPKGVQKQVIVGKLEPMQKLDNLIQSQFFEIVPIRILTYVKLLRSMPHVTVERFITVLISHERTFRL